MEQLLKMRAQDLLNAVMDYCTSPEENDNEAWQSWNRAWEQADDMLRRDALMIAGVYLTEARRELREVRA